jgi:RimJ/RimL family protein N-acetyltransferase
VEIMTARLRLRPYTMADLGFYVALVADPEVMRYVGDGTTRTRRQGEEALARVIGRFDGVHGMHAIERLADGAVVGQAGLLLWDIPEVRETEIAYTLARPFWGQGIATEAATALRDHALTVLGLKRVISLIYPDNRASIRVAEKVGLAHERDVTLHGKPVRMYALNRP